VKKIKIRDKLVEYNTSYRNVKFPRLEFRTGKLKIILPLDFNNEETIIEKHIDWIYKKQKQIDKAHEKMSEIQLNNNRSIKDLKKFISKKVENFSKELNVKINKIIVRKMISKWGSMSSKKNITLNSYLRFLPEKLVEYIIYHELVHLIERKHNKKFWTIIEKKYKNYQNYEKDLFNYWLLVQEYRKGGEEDG